MKRFLPALALVLFSCATSAEVREIVSESNAALSSPELVQPGENGGDWKAAVQKIDRLIAAHPGEERMVAALRVRQALLLTVYKQDALAREAWKLVKAGRLSERDQALTALSDPLIWWYKRGPQPGAFNPAERETAKAAAQAIHARCSELTPGSDARLFLATMATNIELKRANDSPQMTPEEQKAVGQILKESLKKYAGHFDEDDRKWVKANYAAAVPGGVEILSHLRHRFAFRDLIKAYQAKGAGISWEPTWLNELP